MNECETMRAPGPPAIDREKILEAAVQTLFTGDLIAPQYHILEMIEVERNLQRGGRAGVAASSSSSGAALSREQRIRNMIRAAIVIEIEEICKA